MTCNIFSDNCTCAKPHAMQRNTKDLNKMGAVWATKALTASKFLPEGVSVATIECVVSCFYFRSNILFFFFRKKGRFVFARSIKTFVLPRTLSIASLSPPVRLPLAATYRRTQVPETVGLLSELRFATLTYSSSSGASSYADLPTTMVVKFAPPGMECAFVKAPSPPPHMKGGGMR